MSWPQSQTGVLPLTGEKIPAVQEIIQSLARKKKRKENRLVAIFLFYTNKKRHRFLSTLKSTRQYAYAARSSFNKHHLASYDTDNSCSQNIHMLPSISQPPVLFGATWLVPAYQLWGKFCGSLLGWGSQKPVGHFHLFLSSSAVTLKATCSWEHGCKMTKWCPPHIWLHVNKKWNFIALSHVDF